MRICIAILCLLLLVGCSEDVAEVVTAPEVILEDEVTFPEEEVIPEVMPPTNVSPLAEEKLLPIDTYSDPREEEIGYVVIHFTSAVMLSQSDPYNMELIRGIFEDNELSVHYIIDRDGGIFCYITEDRAAWHAGRGSFSGIENRMNHHSVGIELVGMGSESDMSQYLSSAEYRALDQDLVGFTDAQYEALSSLVTDICQRNGIPLDREHIIGHSEYNPSKTDPGELFDFDRLLG